MDKPSSGHAETVVANRPAGDEELVRLGERIAMWTGVLLALNASNIEIAPTLHPWLQWLEYSFFVGVIISSQAKIAFAVVRMILIVSDNRELNRRRRDTPDKL